ncbi:MAG: hypothetical protein E7589_00130 [Ruminococcaceae bacterium]|nr:hypothetical protein [Oscillospiraceae bacterium]
MRSDAKAKILTLAIALAVCIVTLSGCIPTAEQSYLAFRDGDISVHVKGTLELVREDGYTPQGANPGEGSDGRAMGFEAKLSIIHTDSSRISTVEFISPASLSGLEIHYSESGVNFTLNGEKDISSGDLSLKIPNICDAFYNGDIITSVIPREDGWTEIYLSEDGGQPISIYAFKKGELLPSRIQTTTENFKLDLWSILPTE